MTMAIVVSARARAMDENRGFRSLLKALGPPHSYLGRVSRPQRLQS